MSPGTSAAHISCSLPRHRVLRVLRRLEQHELVVLDDETREKCRVVWNELARRKRLDLLQQRRATRPASPAPARRRRNAGLRRKPAPSGRAAPAASACGPCCRGRSRSCSSSGQPPPPTGTRRARRTSSTECRRRARDRPARVSVQPVRARATCSRTSARICSRTCAFGDLERQQALRADRRLDLLVVDERRRSAEARSSARPAPDRTPRPPCSSGTARCASRSASRAASSGSSRSALARSCSTMAPSPRRRKTAQKFRRTDRPAAASPDSTRPARRTRRRDIFRGRRRRSSILAGRRHCCRPLHCSWAEDH